LKKPKDDKFEMYFNYLGWPLIAQIMPNPSSSLHMQLMGQVGSSPYSLEGNDRHHGTNQLLLSMAK
jgi:hypothetical protein